MPKQYNCVKSQCGEIQKLYCNLRPPDITGEWNHFACILQQRDPEVSFDNVTTNVALQIYSSQGVFVIAQPPENPNNPVNPDRPNRNKRIGVWRPIYHHGIISHWELYVTDYDDNQINIVQVATYVNGKPELLQFISTESGFDSNNPLQNPFVNFGFISRK